MDSWNLDSWTLDCWTVRLWTKQLQFGLLEFGPYDYGQLDLKKKVDIDQLSCGQLDSILENWSSVNLDLAFEHVELDKLWTVMLCSLIFGLWTRE